MYQSALLQDLQARGLIAQITDAVLSNTEMTAAAINVIEVRN